MFLIDKHNIGIVIREARKKAKLKQYELAEMAGFTEKHLCRIENGKYLPKLEHFLMLVSILHLTLDDFGLNVEKNKISKNKQQLLNKIITAGEDRIKLYQDMLDYTDKIIEVSKSKNI